MAKHQCFTAFVVGQKGGYVISFLVATGVVLFFYKRIQIHDELTLRVFCFGLWHLIKN